MMSHLSSFAQQGLARSVVLRLLIKCFFTYQLIVPLHVGLFLSLIFPPLFFSPLFLSSCAPASFFLLFLFFYLTYTLG